MSFYTSLIYFILLSDLIMILIISSDNLLNKNNKTLYMWTFFIFLIMTFFEWVTITYINYEFEYKLLNDMFIPTIRFVMSVMTPISIYLLSTTFKRTKFSKFVFYLLSFNVFFQLFILFNDDYYILSQGYFDKGNLYMVYNIIFFIGMLSMTHSILIMSKEYQSKNGFILFFIILNAVVGNIAQIIDSSFTMVFICTNMSGIFLYTYYISVIDRVDVLTGILSRRCYESKIMNLKKDAVIIILDVNKFKKVNDLYGHSFGDYTLKYISNKLVNTYGSNRGLCYRIGGDEFCVIIECNINKVKDLSNKLKDEIELERSYNPKLPNISIGYSYYSKANGDIKNTIEEADKIMYSQKKLLMSKT